MFSRVPFGKKYRVVKDDKRSNNAMKNQVMESAIFIMKAQRTPVTMMFNKGQVGSALKQARQWLLYGQTEAAGTLLAVVSKMINGGRKK